MKNFMYLAIFINQTKLACSIDMLENTTYTVD